MAPLRYFEDFAVGERFTAGPRRVTARDLRQPFDLVTFFGSFEGMPGPGVLALLGVDWRRLAPVRDGDALHAEFTVTRCTRASEPGQGVVHRHVLVRNEAGEHVQEGGLAVLVRTRGAGEDRAGWAFGTPRWAEALASRLADDARFGSAVATWDGTIGLRCGDAEVHLRIYRGRVIEVTRRAPHGATFTLGADEVTWTRLITGPRNDFLRRAMRGEFDVRGSGYEYLRLTKVLDVLVDNARALAVREAV